MKGKSLRVWISFLASILFFSSALGQVDRAKPVKIGILRTAPPYAVEQEQGLIGQLKSCGYVEGKDIIYISKVVGSRVEDFESNRELARELINEGINILATIGTQASVPVWPVVKGSHIPMVFAGVTYPIQGKLIEVFGKPTGVNITGISYGVPPETRLKIFRKMLPETNRFKKIGFVYSGAVPQEITYVQDLKRLKDTSGFQVVYIDFYNSTSEKVDYDLLIRKLIKSEVDLIFGWYSLDQLCAHPQQFTRLQAVFQKPIMGITSKFTDQGALGGVLTDHYALGAQHANMIMKVLSGKDPGEIPPEQPKGYLIEVNLKKARELKIEIPMQIIGAADRIVK